MSSNPAVPSLLKRRLAAKIEREKLIGAVGLAERIPEPLQRLGKPACSRNRSSRPGRDTEAVAHNPRKAKSSREPTSSASV